MKAGKVVIVLSGRYAGRKALIVKVFEEGTKEHPFAHALVAGISHYPRRVTSSMSEKRVVARSKVIPFVKFINLNHLMPTRYSLTDIDLKTTVKAESVRKAGDGRTEAKKGVRKLFEERYLSTSKQTPGVNYFFHKLKF